MVYARVALIGGLGSAAVIGGILALVHAGHADIHSAAALTAMTVSVTAPTAYVLKTVLSEKAEKRRVILAVCSELRDVLEALNRYADDHSATSFLTDGKKEVFFMSMRLSHDMYDSMVFSGKIHLIDPLLHRKVRYVYTMIKQHNYYLSRLWDIAHDKSQLPSDSEYVYGWLGESERLMVKKLPALVRELEGSA